MLMPALSRRSPSNNRSQSAAQGPSSPPGLEQNPPLPSDFHFPQNSSSSELNQPTPSASAVRPRTRVSPTRASASSPQTSLHNPAHSLDGQISTGYPRRPSPPSLTPPVLGRSRSATPAEVTPHDSHAGPFPGGYNSPRRPSLHRLASLTVLETPPAPPTKPFLKSVRGRSANSAGGVGDLPGIPDLKDVLKVDLPHTLLFSLTNTVLSLLNSPLNTSLGCLTYYRPLRRRCTQT
ncbi:hypothetical protein BC826DRAFT_178878 [Russula brevipes]|nr:hypothetical protein BC826DRAFT_178878 [Russula brevipes]